MSIKIMSLVWENYLKGGSEKLAMLALADWSDDAGGRLYPSIKTIASKINVSECQARRIIHGFIDDGYLTVIANHNGGDIGATRHYKINIEKLLTTSTNATTSIDATPITHARSPLAPMRVTTSTSETLTVNNHYIDVNKTIRAKALVLPIPDFVDQQLWKDFIEVRHGLKAKNTLPAINALISQLKKLRDAGHNPADVINASIRSSWKDLYPLKENSKISEKDAGRKAAMASIFKPEHIQHLMKTEKVVQSAEFKRLAD